MARNHYAVFGLGSFGAKLAVELGRAGNAVVVVDIDRERVDELREKVTEAIIADVSNEEVVRELNVSKFDAVILGMSSHFEDQVLALTLLKQEGVRRVLAKANSDIQERILYRLGADEVIQEVPVALSRVDHVTVHPAQEVEVLLPNDLDPAELERTVILQDPVEAPVTEGQALGTLELSHDDTVYASVDLLAMHDVEASGLLTFWRDVQLFFAKTSVRIAGAVILVLLAAVLVWRLVLGRRRYRYGRSVGRRRSGGYRGRRR